MAQGKKWTRQCGVSSFRLTAEGLQASEVYRTDPKKFDDEFDRHFREFWDWINKQPRTPAPKRKKQAETDT